MDHSELTCLLDLAARETRPHVARMHLDAVRPHLGARWVDDAFHARARLTFERLGLTYPGSAKHEPRVGEAWLLLAGPRGQGHVVRLAVGGAGVDPGLAAQSEGRRALHGLHAAAASRGRRVPQDSSARSIGIEGGPARLEIEGGSLGLSMAIATLSAALRKPARSNVAGTAVVRPDALGRVSFLGDKVRALRTQGRTSTPWSSPKNKMMSRRSKARSALSALPTLLIRLRPVRPGFGPAASLPD